MYAECLRISHKPVEPTDQFGIHFTDVGDAYPVCDHRVEAARGLEPVGGRDPLETIPTSTLVAVVGWISPNCLTDAS